MQGALDAYFLKARSASYSQRDQDACSTLSAEAEALLAQLQGAESRNGPAAAPKQKAALQKNVSSVTGKQSRKGQKQKQRLQKQVM